MRFKYLFGIIIAFIVPLSCTTKTISPIQPEAEVVATEEFNQDVFSAAEILFVIDDSGSMGEEQLGVIENLASFIDILSVTGAELRIATVTSDAIANPDGDFFTDFVDNVDGTDIPQAFCNGVINNSQNGVLDSTDPALIDFLANFGPIDDFTDRDPNANQVDPAFSDAVGCIVAAGTGGSGVEVGLCQAAAALDQESVANNNSALLKDPNSILAIIVLGDEDDCALSFQEQNGEFTCTPLGGGNSVNNRCASSVNVADVCDTGASGELENLIPVDEYSERIKDLRGGDDSKIFVATVAGPPGNVVIDCNTNLPEPTCISQGNGGASPGNRMFDFASLFQNRVTADPEEDNAQICGDFDDILGNIAQELGDLLNFRCLNADVDPALLENGNNLRMKIDISNADDVNACSDIVNGVNEEVAIEDPENPEICIVDNNFLLVEANNDCVANFQIGFDNFAPPSNSSVTIEYLALP